MRVSCCLRRLRHRTRVRGHLRQRESSSCLRRLAAIFLLPSQEISLRRHANALQMHSSLPIFFTKARGNWQSGSRCLAFDINAFNIFSKASNEGDSTKNKPTTMVKIFVPATTAGGMKWATTGSSPRSRGVNCTAPGAHQQIKVLYNILQFL